MDVSQPLCRYQDIKGQDGKVFRITISYERLLFFCFLCGTIEHSEKEFVNVDDDEPKRSMGWGKYLHATPRRGVQKLLWEVEEVKSCRKNLFVAKSRCNRTEWRDADEKQEEVEGKQDKAEVGRTQVEVRALVSVE